MIAMCYMCYLWISKIIDGGGGIVISADASLSNPAYNVETIKQVMIIKLGYTIMNMH